MFASALGLVASCLAVLLGGAFSFSPFPYATWMGVGSGAALVLSYGGNYAAICCCERLMRAQGL